LRTRTGRFLKLTIGVELKKRPVRSVKIRRGPCDDNRDFRPVVKKAHAIEPIKVGIGEQGVAHPTKEGGRQGPEEEVAGIRGFEWYHGRKFPAAMVRMYEKMKGPKVVYYYDRKKRRREELLARFNRTGNMIVKLGGEIVAVIRTKDLPYKYVARDKEDKPLKERELRKKALRKKRSE